MNVIIAGAGEVGTHLAEVLASSGHNITVIDLQPERLAELEDKLDVGTLEGNCCNADMLREAGADNDEAAVVAATNSDELNLLCATVSKGVGIGKSIARVHHSAYFDKRGLDYAKHLNIDRLVCPEYSTALAIASTLSNPAALSIENFASGQIAIQEFPVPAEAEAVGKSLIELKLPPGIRLAAIRRGTEVSLPTATTTIDADDVVILVGNADVFPEGRRLFQKKKPGKRRVVVMGGSKVGVWLCRAMRDRQFSIRLFEPRRARAEELAEKLDWVTVVCADPTDVSIFEEEHIGDADAFIGLSDDDEHNILGCAWAHTAGVEQVVSVVNRPRYVPLLSRVGIDHAFSPRSVAARRIGRMLDESPLLKLSSLAEGVIDVYRVSVGPTAEALGQPLRKIKLSPDWMIAALQHEDVVRVPTADDYVHAGDTVTAIGRSGEEDKIRRIFGTG